MATSDHTIRVGVDTQELKALENIPTDAGAILRILEDVANRGQILEVEGQKLVWNRDAGHFVRVERDLRPNYCYTVGKLEDLVLMVARFSNTGQAMVTVNPGGIMVDLDPESADHRDTITVHRYMDPLLTAGDMLPEELAAHLDRLLESQTGEAQRMVLEDFLSILRILTVQSLTEVQVEDAGAHTRITSKASQTVQGTKDGAPVDIPRSLSLLLSFGTRWTTLGLFLKVKALVTRNSLRFRVELEDFPGAETAWMEMAVEELRPALPAALVVHGSGPSMSVTASESDY